MGDILKNQAKQVLYKVHKDKDKSLLQPMMQTTVKHIFSNWTYENIWGVENHEKFQWG